MTEVDKADPPTGYKSIVYNEVWDRTAEAKESKVEESKVEQGRVEESEIEGGNHFEDCE